MERELSHNIPCSPQGGKLSGRGKTILGGIYIHDYCIWFVHATREFGARGEGDYVTCASSPCTASLMLDRDLTEVT